MGALASSLSCRAMLASRARAADMASAMRVLCTPSCDAASRADMTPCSGMWESYSIFALICNVDWAL
eukprot:scaffold65968_cov18-Tisochrysis_lutea.AAC.3